MGRRGRGGRKRGGNGDSSARNFEGCLIASKLVTLLRSRCSAGDPRLINGTLKKRTHLSRSLLRKSPKEPACVMRFPDDLDRPSVIR